MTTTNINISPEFLTLPPIPRYPSPSPPKTCAQAASTKKSQAIQCNSASSEMPNPNAQPSDMHLSPKSSIYDSTTIPISSRSSDLSYESVSSSVFPCHRCIPRLPSYEAPTSAFAYHKEILFEATEYSTHWDSTPIDVTNHLIPRNTNNPRAFGFHENLFAGIRFRLILDPGKATGLGPFARGTIINFCNINTEENKYMVECCQYECDGSAFLKVVCHKKDQRVFPADHPEYPIFILIIPSNLYAEPTPEMFISALYPPEPPLCQMNYAEANESQS